MIKFKDIYIEGFGSYIEPISYKLDSSGVNLLTGHNGSGKSTIIKSLLWCLYKKEYFEPWEDVKPRIWNGTKVVVRLYSGKDKIKVIRCKSYKGKVGTLNGKDRLFIFVNGKSRDDLRDKHDLQREIENILGMSYELFVNSVTFGQGLTKLLKERGPKQKDIFDEAFNTLYINEAKDKALSDSKELDSEILKLELKVSNSRVYIESNDKVIEAKNDQIIATRKRRDEVDEDLKFHSSQLEKLKVEEKKKKNKEAYLAELEGGLVESKNSEKEHFKLELLIVQMSGEIGDLKEESKILIKGKKCIQCDRPLPKEGLKKKLGNLKENIAQLTEAAVELTIKQRRFEGAEDKSDRLSTARRGVVEELNVLTENIGKYGSSKNYITELKNYADDTGLKLLEKHLKEALESKARMETELNELIQKTKKVTKKRELLKWLVSLPLSNKGIKAYIFETRLHEINRALAKYNKITGYRIEFNIDLESGNKNFESTIYKNNKARPYKQLSGGQQQMVDICLIFALHDITTSIRGVNILIMDEIFEGLDEDNIQLVSDLILMKSSKISIHLMTHILQFVIQSTRKTEFSLTSNGHTRVS